MPLVAYGALAAFQVMAGYDQAGAIRQQAQFKQQVDNLNAGYADLDAYNAKTLGYTQSSRYENVIDSTVGAQRTGYAQQNQDVNFGTAQNVQAETRLTGMLNIMDIQRQARERALGFTREASNLRLGGSAAVAQGALDSAAAQTQGLIGAVRTGVAGYDRYATPDVRNLPGSNQTSRIVAGGMGDNVGGQASMGDPGNSNYSVRGDTAFVHSQQYGFVSRDGLGDASSDWFRDAQNDFTGYT